MSQKAQQVTSLSWKPVTLQESQDRAQVLMGLRTRVLMVLRTWVLMGLHTRALVGLHTQVLMGHNLDQYWMQQYLNLKPLQCHIVMRHIP